MHTASTEPPWTAQAAGQRARAEATALALRILRDAGLPGQVYEVATATGIEIYHESHHGAPPVRLARIDCP